MNVAVLFLLATSAPLAFSADVSNIERSNVEHSDEISRDFSLKSIGLLRISNLRGSVSVVGWAQDRIRVRARRVALAPDQETGRGMLAAVDVRYETQPGVIELTGDYGRGLELNERLRERAQPRTSMEMTVFAPAALKLSIFTIDGKVTLKRWNAAAEIRTNRGPIEVSSVHGMLSVLCPLCPIKVHSIRGNLRCVAGSESAELEDVRGETIFVETRGGAIQASQIYGEQLYVAADGGMSGKELVGNIEFQSDQGSINIVEGSGFLSGRTLSGAVEVRMKHWFFAENAILESASGNISITLPSSFSGEVDLRSTSGSVSVEFPVRKEGGRLATPAFSQVSGSVGKGGELLKVSSEKGNIRVLRGS